MEPQCQEVEPEDAVTSERDRVLPEVVVSDGQSPPMSRAVDLDDEVDPCPADVKEDAAARSSSHHLAIGFGESVATAHRREVELAERVRTGTDVHHHLPDEGPPTSNADTSGGSQQLVR